MRFDGMARRVSRSTPADGLLRDGPVELVKLDLKLVAASPVWSMSAALGSAANEQSWASMHLEQAMRVTGTVTLRDQVIEVDNIAFRDHSAGVRDYKSLTGEAWATCAFPSGRLLSAVQVLQESGYSAVAHGWMYDGEKMHDLHSVNLDRLSGTLGEPQQTHLAYHGPGSDRGVDIALQHSMAFSLSEPIGMQLGADGRPGLFVVEGPAHFRWDGEEGLGWLERCTRVAGRT
jgi:predicted secreted hydrolase